MAKAARTITRESDGLGSEISSPATIKPTSYRYPLQAFQGALGQVSKNQAAQDWSEVLALALRSGERIEVASGIYPFRTLLDETVGIVIGDVPVDVCCAADAKWLAGSEIPAVSGSLIRVEPAGTIGLSQRNQPFHWRGGTWDVRSLSPGAPAGISVFDLYWLTGYSIRDVRLDAGAGTNGLWGPCDTGITTHNCSGGVITNCDFVGFYDSGVYLSGNYAPETWDGIGEGETVSFSRFWRCNNGVTMKRDHMGAVLEHNRLYECHNGYLASPAGGIAGSEGEGITVVGGVMKRIQGRPVLCETGRSPNISGLTIEDFGKSIADGTTYTSVASGNQIAAIEFKDVHGGFAHHNTIRQKDWQGGVAPGGNDVQGIKFSGVSKACKAESNIIDGVNRHLVSAAGTEGCQIKDNTEIPAQSGTVLANSLAGTGHVIERSVLEFTQTVDLPSIAAGDTATITIPAPGVAIGDWVEAWSISRGTETTGMNAFAHTILPTTDAISWVVRNVSAGAVNLPNTTWRVRIRRAA